MDNVTFSRRRGLQLLLAAGVLPPVIGAVRPAGAAPATAPSGPLPDALRRLPKPDLTVSQVAQISNDRVRVIFHDATWSGGHTVVRTIELLSSGTWHEVVGLDQAFDEQWVVHPGPRFGHPAAAPVWVGFDTVAVVGENTVELTTSVTDQFDLTVRWVLDGDFPQLDHVLTARRSDDFTVSYQGFAAFSRDDLTEVLCGARQHGQMMVDSPDPLGAWELFIPATLLETGPHTLGLHIPAEVLEFSHARHDHAQRQPFAMSLRRDDAEINPTVHAPWGDDLTHLEAGQQRGFSFALVIEESSLSAAVTKIVRDDLGLTAYRENVYGTSLTSAVHNMVDLIRDGTDEDDTETFRPSFSGWWSRGKGFADIEGDQKVKAAAAGAVLSAHYLTSTPDDQGLWDERARPMIEFQASRQHISFTPIPDATGIEAMRSLGGTPTDAVPLHAVDELLRGGTSGFHGLGVAATLAGEWASHRPSFAPVSAAHQLTGDPTLLAEAIALAEDYIAHRIDDGPRQPPVRNSFGYNYSGHWVDLFSLYEATGREDFLAAAHREARRFITQTMIRPVPSGDVRVGEDHLITQQFDWPTTTQPDYPGTGVTPEDVPAWQMSTTGLTFEQLPTYTYGTSTEANPAGGFTLIPSWAGSLRRLGHRTGDDVLVDLSHDMIIGRFGNYPGYYSRQFETASLKPDFPWQGPPGITSIYYHHIPGHLAMTLDYLMSEAFTRSDGEISFPHVLESNYVFFNTSVYGHRPGSFFGEDGVWPWFPRSLLILDNPQINWIAGVGNDSLYVALMNQTGRPQQVQVDLASPLTGITADTELQVEVLRGSAMARKALARRGIVTVSVPAHELVALAVRDVSVSVPWHHLPMTVDRGTSSASVSSEVRGMLLPRPDGAGHDAYVSLSSHPDQATFEYRIGTGDWQRIEGKPFPYEWTVQLSEWTAAITYRVITAEGTSDETTLTAHPALVDSGTVGWLELPTTTVAGVELAGRAVIWNRGDTAVSAQVTLDLPDGWSGSAGGINAAAGELGETAVTVAVPDGAVGAVEVSGMAGALDLAAIVVTVRAPVRVVELVVADPVLSELGGSTSATAVLVNAGSVARNVALDLLSSSSQWSIDDASATVTVPAESVLRHSFTVRAGSGVNWQGQTSLTLSLEGKEVQTASVALRTDPQIVHNELAWPEYREYGEWLNSGLLGWDRRRTRYSAEGVLGGAVRWRPRLAEDGQYEVSVWYPPHASSAPAARHVVRHRDGEDVFEIDQRTGGSEWQVLGVWDFAVDGPAEVSLEVTSEGVHRASAVRFRPINDSDLTPTLTVDADQPISAPGESGTMSVGVVAGPGGFAGEVTCAVPTGWTIHPHSFGVDLGAGQTHTEEVAITASDEAAMGALHEVQINASGVMASAVVPIGEVADGHVVVVDTNAADHAYVETGSWAGSSTMKGVNGGPTRYARPGADATARWTPSLTEAGRYRVSVWYPYYYLNTRAASYVVADIEVPMNQTEHGGEWRVLGWWSLTASDAAVTVTGLDDRDLRADAVRWERVVPAASS